MQYQDQKVRHSSAEHSRLYGFDPDNGLPSFEEFWQRVHPEDQAGIVEALERANSTGKDFEAHFRVVLPDGTTRFIYCVGHPVFNPSGDGGVVLGISMDITERRQADEERERLRQVQADLAHLSRVTTMGELTASLAHEIRQPIAAAATNAKTCLRWLGRDYPNVEEADDGKTALPMLQAGSFDFLITDWNMPGMPGLDLIKAVRADSASFDARISLITASRFLSAMSRPSRMCRRASA